MRRPLANLASLVFLCAAVALPGCGDGRAFKQAQHDEKAGRYHEAYDQYCRIARKHPGNGSAAAGIRRMRPKAAAFWTEHAQEAADAGRYADAWRMWMRALNIDPTHKDAISCIHRLERNHLIAVQDAKAEWLAHGARTLGVHLPEEDETQVAVKATEPELVQEETTPRPEPVRIASVPPPTPKPGVKTAEPQQREQRVAMAKPVVRPIAPGRNSVSHLAPPMPKAPRRIVRTARPLPRIATAPVIPDQPEEKPEHREIAAMPSPFTKTPLPEASTLVPEPVSKKVTPPPSSVVTAPRSNAVQAGSANEATPVEVQPLSQAASVPETADPAHAGEILSGTAASSSVDDARERLVQTEMATKAKPTEPLRQAKPRAVVPAKPGPKPRIATTADQKDALATSKGNISGKGDLNGGNGADRPKGVGGFLVFHTLSREDRRFPKFARLLDGVDAKLKDTDDDLDADINLYIGSKRIKKIRELGLDRSATFRGQSGKRYELIILGIHHKSHTVRLGIKPA